MALPPIAHHLTINLAGIAERLRFRLDDFVPALARATVRVFRLVLAYTSTAVMRLALQHDALPNPVVRQLLERRALRWGDLDRPVAPRMNSAAAIVISKIIAAILILLFRRRDSAA